MVADEFSITTFYYLVYNLVFYLLKQKVDIFSLSVTHSFQDPQMIFHKNHRILQILKDLFHLL